MMMDHSPQRLAFSMTGVVCETSAESCYPSWILSVTPAVAMTRQSCRSYVSRCSKWTCLLPGRETYTEQPLHQRLLQTICG